MNKLEAKRIVKDAVLESIDYCGSQLILANKAGLCQSAISKYVRGDALPTGLTANKLHAAVDQTVSKKRFAPFIF